MIFYKALRYLFIDNALNIFFDNVKRNILHKPITFGDSGLFQSENYPDLPIFIYIEDGHPLWAAFDRDNFPIGFFSTEDEALRAFLESCPEVPMDEDL